MPQNVPVVEPERQTAAPTGALDTHPHVREVDALLTMHLAPKQMLVNAHINLRDQLTTDEIEQTIGEIETLIKRAEPKVYNIFLEAARESTTGESELVAQHGD